MTTREIVFEGSPPWGFRMNGGADSGHPLRISRVNPGSKAESKGVREGDLITSINGQPTKCLSNSDSHALLRTVKENLRLGLNEDQNGSPRRRSKEIKSSPAASEKSIPSTPADKENTKPSRSKLRRLRKKRLKEILKEKLLGYKETPGHVLTAHPVPEGIPERSSPGRDGPELSAEDDNSSRKLYDNVENDRVLGSVENDPNASFIQEEKVDVVIERGDVGKNEPSQKPMKGSRVVQINSNVQLQNAVCVEFNRPKSPKTVEFLPQRAQVHVWDDKPSLGETRLPAGSSSWSEEKKAVEVVICSPNPINVFVEHPDDVHDESKKFLPPNDLAEVLSSTTDDEEHVYELVVSDIHDPLIPREDEVKLRSYLGSLGLQQPSEVSVQEARVCPPTEIPAYFLPTKRYLDVISEENSDVSDGDRPWENPEKIRQANALIDTIPEDWYGSQDGIDTSWRDGKSLEEMSDIPVVTDSHSDSDAVDDKKAKTVSSISETSISQEAHCLETTTPNPAKKVVSSFFTPIQALPVPVETLKNSATVQGPNSDVVEIVYLDSSDSEAISSSKSEHNLTPTPIFVENKKSTGVCSNEIIPESEARNILTQAVVNEIVSDAVRIVADSGLVTSDSTAKIVGSVSTDDLPKANTEVVEIVCIDSSDSEAVSARSSKNLDASFDLSKEPIPEEQMSDMCVIAAKLPSTNLPKDIHVLCLPPELESAPIESCSKQDMAKISEMINNITDSANEIISMSNEHLARLTPVTSPSLRKTWKHVSDYKTNLKERSSSVPLFEDESIAIKSARSVCSDTGGDESDFPHFICYDSETSSQSTTKPLRSGVTPLRELSLNAVLRLPFGLSFLKELGFDQSEYDSYSGYMPEGSECSFSSKQEREYILEDSDNDNVSISGSLPPRPAEDFLSPPLSEKWARVQSPPQGETNVIVGPQNEPKSTRCTQPDVVDLLDLHQKFVQRRGYHEADDKCVGKYDPRISNKEEEMIQEMSEFRALQEYHALRQKKMRAKKTSSVPELTELSVKPFEFPNKTLNPVKSKSTTKNEVKSDSAFSGVVSGREYEAGKGPSADPGSEGNEVVGNSRLLELIQRAEFKGSSDSLNMSAATYPYWLLLDQQTVSTRESAWKDVPKAGGEDYKQPKVEAQAETENEGNNTNVSSVSDNVGRFESNFLRVDKGGQKERPKSVPPSGEIFRQRMYEEYMNKLAELSQRRKIKAIKISDPKSASTPSVAELDSLRCEFMGKVRERMVKLGLTDDFVLVDSTMAKKPEEAPPEEPKKLPKHVQELMDLSDEIGVWSPAQTPETERKTFDFSSVETREEKQNEKNEEPTPVVWTPRSAGPSPTLGRKFRPVNFQSPPPQRKSLQAVNSKLEEPELPKELPTETTTSATSSSSHSSSSRLISSTSENSTLTSTQLRLPSSQNPTITLLQKAREGQIPKGAQYLDDTAPDRSSGISPDEIIYSVKNEITTADEEGVKKIVELTPKKFSGIGPTTRDGVPIGLRSEVNENNQQRWYKRMYDSLHKTADRDSQYPYSSYSGGYASEPERLGYDSDASVSKYATLDRRKIRNKENDFTTSTLPRNRYAPAVKHAVNIYKNQPGRIEDYEPGNSSIAEVEKKQWWDEVLDIFDGELNNPSKDVYATPSRQSFTTYALKDTGYDSDSTLVFKRRENMSENLSPAEQKMAYKVVQRGGEVPLHGLRRAVPDRPKEPIGNPIPTPPRDHASRLHRQESPHRYVESEVNIHYKTPVRSEAKAAWPEDELAEKQAEIMRRIYQEQRRTKYLNELHDMYSRRHTDNLLPSQKSPIPLNRYDDFPLEPQPPRPRDRTPEPKLVARALYNFVGQTPRELSFRRGDIIYVRRQIDKNWYEGEHNAMIGLFPFNYVEIIPYDGVRTLPKKANEGQARAKFNFQAQTHLELSLVKGELVLLTRRVDENWFEGRIGNRKGIFPVSYVEVLVEPGERTLSPSGPISTKPIVAPASHSVMLNGAKDIGQQHYQPPRPALYSSSSLPPQSKMGDISMVSQSLHIDTQSDPVPYRVLYNYKPQNDDELELKEGDVVYVMEKCDDGWYVGSLHRNGQFGTFPGNYVERILQ